MRRARWRTLIGESFAILAVILVMAFMSVRAGKKLAAVMALPFLCVPGVFLIGEALLYTLRSVTSLPVMSLRSIAVLIGALIGVSSCVLVARGFREKRSRRGYLVFSWVFMVALAFAYFLQINSR